MRLICKHCGKKFERKNKHGPTPMYCSRSCAHSYKRRTNMVKKQCEKCLLCYETHRKEQKYCSHLCAMKKNELPRRYCVVCGRPFKPKSIKKSICCSIKCGKIRGGLTLQKRKYNYPPGLTKREKANFRQNFNRNEKYRTDLGYKLNETIRKGIYSSLINKGGSKNGNHTFDIVEFTLNDLIVHLEKQFTDGMSWDNYGTWHIDHKIPIAVFNFTKPEHQDFKKCWSLSNLQPMWAQDNLSKGASLDNYFQPSLAI